MRDGLRELLLLEPLELEPLELDDTVGGATDGALRLRIFIRGASGNGVVPVRSRIPCMTAS